MRLLILTILLSFQFSIQAQSDRESANSVVKIVATHKNAKGQTVISTASGWAWNQPYYIVTALHAVAGVSNIKVYDNSGKRTTATLVKVIKEGDLALLKLSEDLGLKPLNIVSASPQSTNEFFVWGFPHGVHKIQGDGIKFSRSLEARPTLNSIITGKKLKSQLEQQGYPLPTAEIFRIGSTIQPGHSGAPIFNASGQVIGIADGGLRGGTARINWAMPAAKYVPQLLNSNEQKPGGTSVQTNLYSSAVIIEESNSGAESEEILANDYEASKVSGAGSLSISKSWTATFSEIFDLLDEDDQNDLEEDLYELIEELNLDDSTYEKIEEMTFDIYEDYNTGVSFAVPSEVKVNFNDDLFEIAVGNVYFGFMPFETDSYEESKLSIPLFLENMVNEFPSAQYLEEEDDITDEGDFYEHYSMLSWSDDGEKQNLFLGGQAEGPKGAFLILRFSDVETMTGEDLYNLLSFNICTYLIDFPN